MFTNSCISNTVLYVALIVTTCITIQFGLLRTKEEKEFSEKNSKWNTKIKLRILIRLF